ncbi:MAG: M56 family metallopeptidase [Lachnospiraceae bacterium]|nr:M56 family metallopeptidase [Lachnospiraceae bacterium]
MKILNLSLYASLLILAVLFLRFLFRKAPKWISCLFWALVAIRLLCPVMPESPFSVMPAAEKLPTANFFATETRNVHPEEKITGAAHETPNASYDSKPWLTETGGSVGASGEDLTSGGSDASDRIEMNERAGSKAGSADFVCILTIIWFAGFCLMMMQALFSYLRLKHYVAASVNTGRGVRICDEIRYPFILGIIRPMIYLPGFLKGSMKRFVLAHERAHLKRHDHIWKPLGFFLLAVYWFNPLCWIAYILFSRDLEMACDERVIRNMDRESKADYSQTLLLLSNPANRIAACPVAFGEIGVKERVKGIFNYKKPASWIVALAVVGCIVMAVCFLTSPGKTDSAAAQESESEQPEELQIAATENGDAKLVEPEKTVETENAAADAAPASEQEAIEGSVVFSADIDENGEEDYIYACQSEEDEEGDTTFHWTLELNGKNIYQGSHELFCDFDAWSMDLDKDEKPEIIIRVLPHVNSMPLEEYVALKQEGDSWNALENSDEFEQQDVNGDLSNAFPVQVTVGSEPATVDIKTMDGQTITVNLKEHYEKMMENQGEGEFYTLAEEFLKGDTYQPGDQYGTTAAWGIWEIEGVKVGDENAIRARQGIQSLKGGKWDILGTLDTYFSYDQNGKIKFLKTEFTQSED